MKVKFNMVDFGFINDCSGSLKDKWYRVWYTCIRRCYDINKRERNSTYFNKVTISDEFKLASNFRDFYLKNNPTGEFVMDKDILCERLNIKPKIYSRETIMFIKPRDNFMEMICRKYPIDYYENKKSSARKDFKETCRVRGWKFEDFDEIVDCNSKSRKYFYKFIGNGNGKMHINYKFDDLLKYQYVEVTKRTFIMACKVRNVDYNMFKVLKCDSGKFNFVFIGDTTSWENSISDILRNDFIKSIESKPTTRGTFKRRCLSNNINHDEFIEEKHSKTKLGVQIYTYKHKDVPPT